MTDSFETTSRRLAKARQRGDTDDVAEALALHANELLNKGQTGDARKALDEAAKIHRSCGRTYDEARCTQLAATLCRFEGRLEEAKQRAQVAVELMGATGPVAVSAYTELGEIALAEGCGDTAATAYSSALACGEETGLIDSARAAILRRLAAARVVAKQFQAAAQDLETAYGLLAQTGDQVSARRTLIEEATAFQHAGQLNDAEGIINRAMKLAKQANDHAALADVHLLQTTQAVERRDARVAMASARAAREQALLGNAPTSYIGAAVAIAELAEASGDRVAAYEALATGWVTLADLLNQDTARATFAPKLQEMRKRWGHAVFAEIKGTYEAGRKYGRLS